MKKKNSIDCNSIIGIEYSSDDTESALANEVLSAISSKVSHLKQIRPTHNLCQEINADIP